jgi:hypothetical protein
MYSYTTQKFLNTEEKGMANGYRTFEIFKTGE